MNKIDIPKERQFNVTYDIPLCGLTSEVVNGQAFHSQVFDLNGHDLINVSNLDVGKQVFAKTYGDKILVKRVA